MGRYVSILNGPLEDKNLSLRAKGLLAYMVSRPDNWRFSVTRMAKDLDNTEFKVRNALKELEREGYVKRTPRRKQGQVDGWDYKIYKTHARGYNEK